MKPSLNDSDDDNFELVSGRPVLKDGRSFRVPVRLMDSAQRQLREHFTRGPQLHDGYGGPVGFRPGFVMLDSTALRDAREQARARYVEEITGAYNAPPTGFGPRAPVGARENDGARGHLKRSDGELLCVPDRRQDDASMADTRERAAQKYREWVSNAWRG
jgi:hypothetical protein